MALFMTQTSELSPMMQQWHELKKLQPDAILLFRLGDFYEAFHQDADILSKELDITLTKRQEVPMSGIPHHAAVGYIDTLLEKGYKIALAEQLEDPKSVKGLVKRGIVRVLSPGAALGSGLMNDHKYHFIASLVQKQNGWGVAWIDVSLHKVNFEVCYEFSEALNLINLIQPKEILISPQAEDTLLLKKALLPDSVLFKETLEIHKLDEKSLEERLKKHFNLGTLHGLGIDHSAALFAVGALFETLQTRRLVDLKNITSLCSSEQKNYLQLDQATQKHLELFEKKEGRHKKLTLLHHLDHTLTAGGARLFETWLKFPLIASDLIIERQKAVTYFKSSEKTPLLRKALSPLKDLQKIVTKLEQKLAGPKDLKALGQTLSGIAEIKALLQGPLCPILSKSLESLDPHTELCHELMQALVEDPPVKLHEGTTFKLGYHLPLDETQKLLESQETFLKDYENRLKLETGIKTLKVGSSKAFGFYVEISKGQAANAPSYFIRRQTLTQGERFITEELSEFEKRSYRALNEHQQIEAQLFLKLIDKILCYKSTLIKSAESIALLDVLQSLGTHATKPGYALPTFSDDDELYIEQGRHPIIEELVGSSHFMANSLKLDRKPDTLMLITGPNMAGKSTYMRQACLCVIMAQIGSYVPATSMRLSPCDKVFTRIGASDDLTSGQSTFMVEMSETAYILNHATEKSLVILDEIGRGTSTYDGIAIAYAVALYLLHHPKGAPKTLFATHYFELTSLEKEDPRIVNYNVGVKETAGKLLFLHKILKGAADRSYGIHVAKLSGLPQSVIQHAEAHLQSLLSPHFELFKPTFIAPSEPKKSALEEALEKIIPETLTPIEALNLIAAWKKQYLT